MAKKGTQSEKVDNQKGEKMYLDQHHESQLRKGTHAGLIRLMIKAQSKLRAVLLFWFVLFDIQGRQQTPN